MKKHITIVLALALCFSSILMFASCGAQKLETTKQYKAITEMSAGWTEQTSLGTILAARLASETIPGILYDRNVRFTGDKFTVADAYVAWQEALDQYYSDTLTGIDGHLLHPDAYANAVNPGEYDDTTLRKLLSTKWTINEDHSISDDVASALELAIFDGTEYATAFEEPVHKKDVDVTVEGVRYAGFILVEPDYNLWGPDTISVTVVLAYIPSSKSPTKANINETTKATINETTKATTETSTMVATTKEALTTEVTTTKATTLTTVFDNSSSENSLLLMMKESFVDYADVKFKKETKTYEIIITDQAFIEGIGLLLVDKKNYPTLKSSWNNLVGSTKTASEEMTSSYPGYTVSILNPHNQKTSLLIVIDGIIKYDAFSE